MLQNASPAYGQTTIPNYGFYQQPTRPMPQTFGLKGRPVSSLEEVRATGIDFDGSIFYFPSLADDKIYTKQINMDGTSTLSIYEKVEQPQTPAPQEMVSKEEFTKTIDSLLEEIAKLKGKPEKINCNF